nr:glycerate kinase [uncultured Devosia sp.]
MHKNFLADLFHQAVAAADPANAIAANLPPLPPGRTVVVGAGKAALSMYLALQDCWPGPLSGILVTGNGQGVQLGNVEVLEAGHPLPDERGQLAARKIGQLISGLGPDDLVIALISGGGSAMLPAPPDGLTLADEIALGQTLLASGAPISAMNTVRKHVSTIKGGRLAAAARARVHTLVVSDIPGDIASQVASGPTLPDASTRKDALDIVARYALALPPAVKAHLLSPAADAPAPDDPVFARHTHAVVASAQLSLVAASRRALENGVEAMVLSDSLEGEAREAGGFHAALTRQIRLHGEPAASPIVLMSGGETTVTLRGKGRGGRNGEFLLAWAIAMDGVEGVEAIAADTDGRDGSERNAGAFADSTTVQRLRDLGLDARELLAQNDSYAAFSALGDLFDTGPTGTNVNDFRAIYIR